MAIFRRMLALTAVLACAAAASTHAANAAMQKPALLTTVLGTWNCTYTGPKGKQTSSITFTKLNDLWVQGVGHNGAYAGRPANDGVTLIGYDAKKKQYVAMGGSTLPGDYGVGTASASPAALDMTFAGAYPADPTHDKTTYHFAGNKMTSTDTWTEKGKNMTGHSTCTKH